MGSVIVGRARPSIGKQLGGFTDLSADLGGDAGDGGHGDALMMTVPADDRTS